MLDSMEASLSLLGANERNLPLIENELKVKLALRGAELEVEGTEEAVEMTAAVVDKLCQLHAARMTVDRTTLRYALSLVKRGQLDRLDEIPQEPVAITHRGRPVRCKTFGQYEYVKAIREHELTFAVGPAGTGKTYLAMALAVVALRNKEVERIVLTRPAVEAGEKLGFLPGDLSQKVDPYLRPLFDALYEMMGAETLLYLDCAGTKIIAKVPSTITAKTGDHIRLALNIKKVHVFDKETEQVIFN
jgi:phosphate starvation-inducible PhoH-like protein